MGLSLLSVNGILQCGSSKKEHFATPGLKNLTLSFINHRVPTERSTGAIKIAHTSATSNPARCLFISLWQMV